MISIQRHNAAGQEAKGDRVAARDLYGGSLEIRTDPTARGLVSSHWDERGGVEIEVGRLTPAVRRPARETRPPADHSARRSAS